MSKPRMVGEQHAAQVLVARAHRAHVLIVRDGSVRDPRRLWLPSRIRHSAGTYTCIVQLPLHTMHRAAEQATIRDSESAPSMARAAEPRYSPASCGGGAPTSAPTPQTWRSRDDCSRSEKVPPAVRATAEMAL
ncbi:hypothetical protein FA09DRAFT_106754 [Tilletiopsis washingtonensis]|jgi:hypothetical protein|uniref:Uncharacterized protein n=1 Tax=Tilletiopsis washingtonensis TaxID=58919 RepID=A0A316Z567_9BASI|nr:hypothetical protein FA09DRAFT_106754 [Tilletiopsis washingtonensis]PWN96108.1 hypothetical protein FA09DRAFT_106754 [Tilletiopsis washingtonensis]